VGASAVLEAILNLQTTGFDTAAKPDAAGQLDPKLPAPAVVPQRDVYGGGAKGVPLADTMAAFAKITDHFTAAGFGSADYWSMSHADFAAPARALGTVMTGFAEHASDPTVRAALTDAAKKLIAVPTNGYGDVDYWRESVATLVKDVRASMADLVKYANLGGAAPVEPKEVLKGFSTVARHLQGGGYGDVDYWIKVSSDLDKVCDGLGDGLKAAAANLPEPKRTVVSDIADGFVGLNAKGFGDVSYWSSRTGELRGKVAELTKRLDDVIATL
jgi:hypothetical protein